MSQDIKKAAFAEQASQNPQRLFVVGETVITARGVLTDTGRMYGTDLAGTWFVQTDKNGWAPVLRGSPEGSIYWRSFDAPEKSSEELFLDELERDFPECPFEFDAGGLEVIPEEDVPQGDATAEIKFEITHLDQDLLDEFLARATEDRPTRRQTDLTANDFRLFVRRMLDEGKATPALVEAAKKFNEAAFGVEDDTLPGTEEDFLGLVGLAHDAVENEIGDLDDLVMRRRVVEETAPATITDNGNTATDPGLAENPKEAIGMSKPPTSVIPVPSLIEIGKYALIVSGLPSNVPPLSLLHVPTLYSVGIGCGEGGFKYGRHNYRAAGRILASVYYDATGRHLDALAAGQDMDPDSGLYHGVKAICSLIVLHDSVIKGTFNDDRPPEQASNYQFPDYTQYRDLTVLDMVGIARTALGQWWEGGETTHLVAAMHTLWALSAAWYEDDIEEGRFRVNPDFMEDAQKVFDDMSERIPQEKRLPAWTQKRVENAQDR